MSRRPLILLPLLAALAMCCPRGQYHSNHLCLNCTKCESGLVVLRPCEVHRDAVCVPVDRLFAYMTSGASDGHRLRHEKSKKHWEKGEEPVVSTEVAFSGAETLVWDWQAVALTAAVLACAGFFLVVAMYSLYQARQWRRLKENFDADVEELSARLSLMATATSSSEKAEMVGLDGNYLNSRCVYLEQLLNGRKKDPQDGGEAGNVYIQENNSAKA